MSKIVTISREFGSGGRTIGRMAAEKLGVPCYDQELIDKIAEESGLIRAYVEENSENVAGGWLSFTVGRDFYGHSLQDDLTRAQTNDPGNRGKRPLRAHRPLRRLYPGRPGRLA
jgi:hypothetical protein